jgi:ferric iron reductase protein FhuF
MDKIMRIFTDKNKQREKVIASLWVQWCHTSSTQDYFFVGLLRHVVSDKYVDVDFENVYVELSKKV